MFQWTADLGHHPNDAKTESKLSNSDLSTSLVFLPEFVVVSFETTNEILANSLSKGINALSDKALLLPDARFWL